MIKLGYVQYVISPRDGIGVIYNPQHIAGAQKFHVEHGSGQVFYIINDDQDVPFTLIDNQCDFKIAEKMVKDHMTEYLNKIKRSDNASPITPIEAVTIILYLDCLRYITLRGHIGGVRYVRDDEWMKLYIKAINFVFNCGNLESK